MRLIDADAWVEELEKKYQKTGPGKKGMRDLASDMVLNMIEKIEKRPTAYDVHKVLKKLEELRHPYTTFPQGYGALNEYDYYIDKAISIVKGVDMDE